MRAETMMNEYPKMKKELAMLDLQLKNFRGISEADIIDSMTFAAPQSGDRVQNNKISDKTCSIALSFRERMRKENADYIEFLYGRYKRLKEELDFFENAVRLLGEKRSDIIFELLDGDLTWDMICQQYDVSRSTISNYRKSAIKDIDELYAQRAQAEMDYLMS